MKDKLFLEWLHERLEHQHGENPMVDYMHKLRAIINTTPEDKITPNNNTGNGLKRQSKNSVLAYDNIHWITTTSIKSMNCVEDVCEPYDITLQGNQNAIR
jgi:hypothetical protein